MQISNFEDKKYQRLPSRAKYIVSSVYRNGILDGNLCSDRQRLLYGNWIEGNSTAFDDTTQSLLGKIPPTAQDLRPFIPAGCLVHSFSYQMDHRTPLSYLYLCGSDMGFYVWLNGKFLGSNDLSHAPAEFTLSGIIAEEDNLLEILAVQWCDNANPKGQAERRA